MQLKKLRRPKEGRKWAGVCAGIAKSIGVDVTFVRLAWVLICLFPPVSTLVALLLYVACAYIIPEETDYIDV